MHKRFVKPSPLTDTWPSTTTLRYLFWGRWQVPRDFAVLPGLPVKKGWEYCSFRVPSQKDFFNLLFWDNSTLNLGLSIAHNQALPLQNIVDSIRSFNDAFLVRSGKAGRSRWLGKRPTVRGSVMNPCDHPHGGGEE